MKNNKILFRIIGILIVMIVITGVYALDKEFAEAEKLIKSKVSCDSLAEDKLELIGDYYMEQMHPGELHTIMEERMGGEGSSTLKQAHIAMAQTFYCGQGSMMNKGMMNMMTGRSYGMMNYYPLQEYQSYKNNNYQYVLIILGALIIVLLIIIIWQLGLGRKK